MAKFKALGTQLQVSNMAASAPVFTAVAQLTSISGPGGTTEEIDVTTHDSASAFRENLAAFKDPGEIDIAGVLDLSVATHGAATGLASLYNSGATVNWKLVLPTATFNTLTFAGWVKEFKMDEPFDKAITFTAKIRLTGAITFPTS